MHVLFINQFYLPDHAATAQFLGDLTKDLVQQSHTRISVIASTTSYSTTGQRLSEEPIPPQISIYRTPATNFGKHSILGLLGVLIDYLTFYLGTLWLAFRVPKPDIVVTLSTPPLISLVGCLIKTFRNVRYVYWVQDIYPDVGYAVGAFKKNGLIGKSIDWLNRLSLRHADSVIALGPRMAERLQAKGVPAAKLTIIHHWADGTKLTPQTNATTWRKEKNLPDGFLIQYSGNMGRGHDFDTLLQAAKQLCSNSPNKAFHLLFIGDGAQKPVIERKASALNLKNVHMMPYQPRHHLNESLNAADLALITLQPELDGHLVPSKLYALMAVGKPCLFIGPQTSEVAQILTNAQCGITVQPGDVKACIDALNTYINNEALRRQHGLNARAYFEQHFEKSLATEKFRNLFASLLATDRSCTETRNNR